jgi:uncharacterized membrane protein YgdD (TMEM256/DUF423 family)
MSKLWLILGAVNGFLAVAMGAFGAHGLEKRLNELNRTGTFETAASYHMYHALSLVAVAWLASRAPGPMTNAAGWCFLAGIVLFSGSLYALSLTDIRVLGAITPFGGTLFLIGWALVAVAGFKLKP